MKGDSCHSISQRRRGGLPGQGGSVRGSTTFATTSLSSQDPRFVCIVACWAKEIKHAT